MSSKPTDNSKPIVSTALVDQAQVVIEQYSDVVDNQWKSRHYKLIYKIGVDRYSALAERARQFGKPPKALMGFLVNKELKK